MRRYRVIADPRERPLEEQGYDGVICTGDMLDYAPPPGEDPEGSVFDAFVDDADEVYGEGDPGAIMEEIEGLKDVEGVREEVERRYRVWFESLDVDLFYIGGNLDVPDVLEDVAAEYDHVEPVDALEGVHGFDGFVPSFAGLPEGVFPGRERSEEEFEDLLEEAEGYVLAHTVPSGLEVEGYDVEVVYASIQEGEQPSRGDIVRLEPLDEGGEAVLELP